MVPFAFVPAIKLDERMLALFLALPMVWAFGWVTGYVTAWAHARLRAHKAKTRRWNQPMDVIWCWRFLRKHKAAKRVRFVWRPLSASADAGIAFLDQGRIEVAANVCTGEGEAVVTALHEQVHFEHDNKRHDRAFFNRTRERLVEVTGTAGSFAEVRFQDASSIAKIEGIGILALDLAYATRCERRPRLHWRRRARLGGAS